MDLVRPTLDWTVDCMAMVLAEAEAHEEARREAEFNARRMMSNGF